MDTPRRPSEVFSPNPAGNSLLRTLPPVLRARDFYLYTPGRRKAGGRLVDLWQNGGGAILGHKPPAVLRDFKNAASRGLLSPLPHPLEQRLFKALGRIFPRRVFRIYAAGTSPAAVWEAAGLPPPGPTADPAVFPWPPSVDLTRPGDLSFWRPFLDEAAPLAAPEGPPALIPLIPGLGRICGRLDGPLILALHPALAQKHPFPPPNLIPPALLAVLIRGLYDLIAAGPERGACPFPKLRAAIDRGPWKRRGLYLSRGEVPEPAAWAETFFRFLAAGFLIPPSPEEPLILPGVLSPGEEAKLTALLAEPGAAHL
jgi:hypothetical protein